MNYVRNTRILLLGCLTLVACSCANIAHAQSYGEVYQKNFKVNPVVADSNNRYMYNKYFKSNPNISPYISGAVLGGSQYGDAYTTVVAPELARRGAAQTAQSQYIQQRKLQGNIGHTANPGAISYGAPTDYRAGKPVPAGRNNSGAYQNHWYGQWNK
ncbi:hypothetical protein [Aeoliella sp. SH292]|uniref:hypothetical protein n=1 Tax=Aeoliella sp. SH292 TaxID=3454464 RepID=UPI003F96DE3C